VWERSRGSWRAALYPPPDHFTRIPLLSSRVFLRQGVPYHPAQERRGAGKVWCWWCWCDVGVWMCGKWERRRGQLEGCIVFSTRTTSTRIRILLLSSRVLLHQGVPYPYHPGHMERRGTGEVRWKGDDDDAGTGRIRMWVCGCVGRVCDCEARMMRMRGGLVPRSRAFWFWCERERKRGEKGKSQTGCCMSGV